VARLTRLRGWAFALLPGLTLACDASVPPQEIQPRLAAEGPPHLVLCLVDTLRADATTPYGGPDTTPELAAWAARGILFENARAQSSWTKISMASLKIQHQVHALHSGTGSAFTQVIQRGNHYQMIA
jgi:hypothetical protein